MIGIEFALCLLPFASLLHASAISNNHEVHEKRHADPPRWAKRDRVPAQKLLPMRIGLAQTNLEAGYELLMDVSNPESPNFGKHWTSEEVIEAFRPSTQTQDQVREWLLESGIPAARITHTENKGWFAFYATAQEAEELLHTEYHEYEDVTTGGIVPACDKYHVPQHLRQHIDYITPGVKLQAPAEFHQTRKNSAMASATERSSELEKKGLEKRRNYALTRVDEIASKPDPHDLSTCDVAITPACVAALYGIPRGTLHSRNNSLGIFESELQFYTQHDLDLFYANFTQWIPRGTTPLVANIDGGQAVTTDPYQAGGEAALDIQLSIPIIYPQLPTVYNVDDFIVQSDQLDTYTYGFNTFLDALDGSYCNFTAYGETGNDPNLDQAYPDGRTGGWAGSLMCGVFKPTNVISLSYGGQESDLPITYQKRQCLEYLKLGLQGVSFLYASGDSGVSNYPGDIDGPTGCLGPNLDVFNPTWPGTCPYVTSVGATKVYPGKTVYDPESAVFDPAGHPYGVNYSSGGGFSNIYPIPQYQASAVSTFFEKYNPPYKYYSALSPNTTNQTLLPDIGALAGSTGGIYNRIGRGIPDVAANGDNIAVYNAFTFGLSGGTSASTPIFSSVINRINEERIDVGKRPIGFLNPSMYANPAMFNDITNGTNPGCDTNGFSAVPGWDPVTGLGTPNYPKMLKYYLSLP